MNELSVERDGPLMDIVLDRPNHGNAMSEPMRQKMLHTLRELPDDIRLVRLLAVGSDFCRGRDSPMPPPGSAVDAMALEQSVASPALELYAAIRDCPAPVLAVVRGAAHGFGCALVMASDLALAADEAEFLVPEMQRDVPPLLVMSSMLRRLAPKTIMRMVLARDMVDGKEAMRLGLVCKSVPRTQLEVEARHLTERLLTYTPVSARAVKRYLNAALYRQAAEASALAGSMSGEALATRYC